MVGANLIVQSASLTKANVQTAGSKLKAAAAELGASFANGSSQASKKVSSNDKQDGPTSRSFGMHVFMY